MIFFKIYIYMHTFDVGTLVVGLFSWWQLMPPQESKVHVFLMVNHHVYGKSQINSNKHNLLGL